MPQKISAKSLDCYTAADRGFLERTQRFRARALHPLLALLSATRVRADHLTLVSLACGIGFALLWSTASPISALSLLVLHALLDALDGPLARHQGRATSRGSFTDTMVDQVVVASSTFALIASGHAGALDGAAYVFTYTVVIFFAMARNALAIPYDWLLRPRMIVYAWIPVELWLLPGSLDVVLRVFIALLGLKLLSGFWKIRRRLDA